MLTFKAGPTKATRTELENLMSTGRVFTGNDPFIRAIFNSGILEKDENLSCLQSILNSIVTVCNFVNDPQASPVVNARRVLLQELKATHETDIRTALEKITEKTIHRDKESQSETITVKTFDTELDGIPLSVSIEFSNQQTNPTYIVGEIKIKPKLDGNTPTIIQPLLIINEGDKLIDTVVNLSVDYKPVDDSGMEYKVIYSPNSDENRSSPEQPTVKLILNGRAPLKDQLQLPGGITLAAARGNQLKLRQLVQDGADPNVNEAGRNYPIICAAMNSKFDTVRLLAQFGVDLNQGGDDTNLTCLHILCSHTEGDPNERASIIRFLAQKGADINARHSFSQTPLVKAILAGQPEVVIKALLDSGADTNHSFRLSSSDPTVELKSYVSDSRNGVSESVATLMQNGAPTLQLVAPMVYN